MIPWLTSAGSFIANNKAMQWAIGAAAVIISILLYGEHREMQGREQQKLKQEKQRLRDEQAARDKTEQIKQEAAHEADKALEARDTAGPIDSHSMSDADFYRHFGYRRTPREISD